MKFTKAVNLNKNGSLKKIGGTNNWIVEDSFVWFINYETKNEYIMVESGFDTDFGSIPKIFWPIFDPTKYVAYILHDYLYRKGSVIFIQDINKCDNFISDNYFDFGDDSPTIEATRKQADYILKQGLKVEGMGFFKRIIVYYTLRLFGSFNFKKREMVKAIPIPPL